MIKNCLIESGPPCIAPEYYILASCCTKRADNKERQESKHAHKNQETNENTTEKHKLETA
jgi:hypothetical protein